ncbi:hypothetical protein [Thiolapillus sp.]
MPEGNDRIDQVMSRLEDALGRVQDDLDRDGASLRKVLERMKDAL